MIGTSIVHQLILSENTSGSSSCNTDPIRIGSSAFGHILRMGLVVVCPDVAIEVLVDPTRHSRTSHIPFGPGLRLSHSRLVASGVQHFGR